MQLSPVLVLEFMFVPCIFLYGFFLPHDTLAEDVFSDSPLLTVLSGMTSITSSPRNVSPLGTKYCTHQTNPN